MNLLSSYDYFNFYKLKNTFYKKYVYLIYFYRRSNERVKINKNFYKDFLSYKVITFHYINKKLRIIVTKNNKIILNFSSGIVTKKLGFEEKKNKKSIKTFNIMVKSVLKGLRPVGNIFKCILQFKGTTVYIKKYLELLKKLDFKFKEVYYIYTPKIPNKTTFRKVRSLKKNFKKKFLSVF